MLQWWSGKYTSFFSGPSCLHRITHNTPKPLEAQNIMLNQGCISDPGWTSLLWSWTRSYNPTSIVDWVTYSNPLCNINWLYWIVAGRVSTPKIRPGPWGTLCRIPTLHSFPSTSTIIIKAVWSYWWLEIGLCNFLSIRAPVYIFVMFNRACCTRTSFHTHIIPGFWLSLWRSGCTPLWKFTCNIGIPIDFLSRQRSLRVPGWRKQIKLQRAKAQFRSKGVMYFLLRGCMFSLQ